MADHAENLVLEHLRALRADTNEVKNDLHDVKARLASIEGYIATSTSDTLRALGDI